MVWISRYKKKTHHNQPKIFCQPALSFVNVVIKIDNAIFEHSNRIVCEHKLVTRPAVERQARVRKPGVIRRRAGVEGCCRGHLTWTEETQKDHEIDFTYFLGEPVGPVELRMNSKFVNVTLNTVIRSRFLAFCL